MKDKAILKKWWFWVVVVVVLGGIGSLGQGSKEDSTPTASNSTTQQPDSATNATTTLPKLNTADYTGKEGLVVYKELKSKGYKVTAEFEKQALTDMNGKASDVFEPLDPNKANDRQSVDSFVVGNLSQDGDNITLTIAKSSN